MFRSTKVRYALGGAIALALIALVVMIVRAGDTPADPDPTVAPSSPRCSNSVPGGPTTNASECLGPVNDSQALHPDLREVAEKILRENREIAKGTSPYVKVALLTPLSVAPPSIPAMSLEQVRYSLEGAYTALRRANTTTAFGDKGAPSLQLLLVNQGSRQEHTPQLVQDMLALGEKDHPLVAVVGLGSSFAGTLLTAEALSAENMPMVSAVTSATSLTAEKFETFHSVSPSNVEYALALKDLLDKNRQALPLKRGIVVADINKDPYPETLTAAFTSVLKDYVIADPQPFVGSTQDHRATPLVFDPAVTNICNADADASIRLDTVFFAGRVADFPLLAEALAGRTCRNTPLTVLVGATGFQAAESSVSALDRGNVTVIYASSADAPTWIKGGPDVPEGFPEFLASFEDAGFAAESLNDGYAVSYHDALATVARAVRVAAQGSSIPTAADVQVQIGSLKLAYRVRGASGTLSFGPRTDGRSVGNKVVYRQLGKGSPRLPASVKSFEIAGCGHSGERACSP